MLARLIEAAIAREESRLGEEINYLRYVLRTSQPAFFNYMKVISAARFRKQMPLSAWHASAILASMHERCGNCAQIELNLAEAAGVSREILIAVIEGRISALPDDVRDSVLFTKAVLAQNAEQDDLRRRIVERFGDAGLVELSLRLAISRMLPVMTRALGFSETCADMKIRD